MRFRYMILSAEPLPHEVFGLQILLGVMGTQIAGLVGCLMGTFQVAPCLSWLPGKAGHGLRYLGWQTFAMLRSSARSSVTLWRKSGLSSAADGTFTTARKIDEDTKASARASALSLAVLRASWTLVLGFFGTVANAGNAAARISMSRRQAIAARS